MHTAIKDNASL